MRKIASFAPLLIFLFIAPFASAQQLDFFVGGGTLLSSSPTTGALFFQPPAEKGGTYINLGGDVVGFKRRLGFNIETAWKASQGIYSGENETYRPILTDFNALFQPKFGKKLGLDLMGGIGVAATRFYVPEITSCSYFSGGCINYTSSDHFMEHLGAGVRYYVWRHFFVRPEIHYYHIQNNIEFNSDSVFRVGASIGYTIGSD
ncbi:MAG: outer membrane beta-barrel protein [Candidatus Sulfotelmatobacter sp.]